MVLVIAAHSVAMLLQVADGMVVVEGVRLLELLSDCSDPECSEYLYNDNP